MFVLAVALSTALVVRNVRAVQMENMDVAAAMTMATDMPMHGKCDGCAGNEKAMTAACSAYCVAVVALPFLVAAYHPVPSGTVEPSLEPVKTGYATPPDPYPPRPTRIS